MLEQRIWVLCIIAGGIVSATTLAAAAQQCDDRYPVTCPGFNAPSLPTPETALPRAIAPQPGPRRDPNAPAAPREPNNAHTADPTAPSRYAALYAQITSEAFAIPSVNLTRIDPQFLRRTVSYTTNESPGTIIVDPQHHFLYLVEGGGQAVRYGVGVGRQGFGWSGTATIHEKREWPDWYPPKEMIQRQPELRRHLTQLQSGVGMQGGPRNPLGSRALYLWQGNKDTLFRIHGTVEPWTIGSSVSSGCIRMINQDVIDLYKRTHIGAKVVVLGQRP
jgi:lipoprotein-anchoring transpeptidase ErfK/SrfK